MRNLVGVSLLILGLAACRQTIVVESTTSWTGYYGPSSGGQQVSGTGNAEFRPPSSGQFCWNFQKTTEQGILRAYLRDHTFPNLIATKDGDQTTTTPFGIVAGCK